MKIKQEHYKELKEVIEHGADPTWKERYNQHGLSNTRYVWDIFTLCVPSALCSKLYEYLNDSHIETALLRIVGK